MVEARWGGYWRQRFPEVEHEEAADQLVVGGVDGAVDFAEGAVDADVWHWGAQGGKNELPELYVVPKPGLTCILGVS